jgi:hypothetical protein
MKPILVMPRRLAINRYVHLLGVLVIAFLLIPLFAREDRPLGIPVLAFLVFGAILLALRLVTTDRRLFGICCGLVVLGFVLDVVAAKALAGAVATTVTAAVRVVYAGFLLIVCGAMLRQLFTSRTITVDTILGGISLYFLLGVLWAVLYAFVQLLEPATFGDVGRVQLFFFSFTTLTTLGYGDISPATPYGMVLANLEAIVGQMYVAVFIARLVGLHIVSEAVEEPLGDTD